MNILDRMRAGDNTHHIIIRGYSNDTRYVYMNVRKNCIEVCSVDTDAGTIMKISIASFDERDYIDDKLRYRDGKIGINRKLNGDENGLSKYFKGRKFILVYNDGKQNELRIISNGKIV